MPTEKKQVGPAIAKRKRDAKFTSIPKMVKLASSSYPLADIGV